MAEYFYVVVRRDIPVADQLCQVAHACAEAGDGFGIDKDTYVVMLEAKDKEELLDICRACQDNEIAYVEQIEPDHTFGLTAISTDRVPSDKRKVFRSCRLWR